jgi:hypothetical protein
VGYWGLRVRAGKFQRGALKGVVAELERLRSVAAVSRQRSAVRKSRAVVRRTGSGGMRSFASLRMTERFWMAGFSWDGGCDA